ncbi:hypothetical protein CK203_027292 [Vitis vinifera]|uniref:Integrase catalytic domain-containing protein n=1 Tax=Vitis vinifera TaxID=29760 RepID=A0A438J9H6_VITVI|nr:hypothetical protein CK203_027292 [Vitis vinifera]
MPLSRAFQKLAEGGLLTALAPKPPPQPMPPHFRLDLHCAYHQGPGHDTNHCSALRHAIQDLIDQGLVNLGQPSHRVQSVLLNNGSALNVYPLATVVTLDFAPSDFGSSTQTLRAYNSTQREVMGTLTIDLLIGLTTFSILFQVLRIPSFFDLLLGRPWIHQARAIPSSLHQKDSSLEGMMFVIWHDYVGTGGLEVQPHVEEMGVDDSIVDEFQHMLHKMKMGDETPSTSASVTIAPPSPDRANLFSLCFLYETTDFGVVIKPADMIDGVVPHDEYRDKMDMLGINQFLDAIQRESFSLLELFRVSVIEIAEEDQTVLAPKLPTFVVPTIDMYEGTVGPYSSVSYDSISVSAPHSPIPQMFDINNEIAQPDSDRDSFDHDSDPIDERVSPVIGDVETVDFGTNDQPRELKIGLPLSTYERDRLIHLIKSYLDVFAWSYEDMSGLDPSIVQHHLPFLPHTKPVKYNQILMALEDMKKTTFITERVPPMSGCPLLLYLSVSNMALGSSLLSTSLAIRRLRHYMTEYLVYLISRLDPLRYLFDRPALAVHDDFPDEEFVTMTRLSGWHMYFDGAANHLGYGIGVLLVSPQGDHIPRYVQGDGKTRDMKLKPYHAYLELLIENFEELKYSHIPITQNQFVDVLATLASTVDIPTNVIFRLLLIETRSTPTYCHLIDETKISPKSSNSREFILVAIDYFTKWMEAASYAKLTSARVSSFIKSHIISRYGVPHELISDRGAHLRAEVETLLQKYGIQHHKSSAYRS